MNAPVGLLGGTFDPVHFAHLRLALEALERLPLDSIRWIHSGQPGHRGAPSAGVEHRLAMLRLAIGGEPRFSLDAADALSAAPTFTVNTLARLRAEAEVLSGGRHTVVLNAQPGFDLLGAERDITSALGNLVANAIRYTQPGGEVRILWQVSAKGGEFIVEDTGIGIEAKHIPLLTERFYRVQKRGAQSRRGTGGAGLGLAIVKAVLSRHQAVLEISSEAGKGSRFVARFPLQRVAASRLGIASLAA